MPTIETAPETRTENHILPPYNVIIKNDDFHSMAFVIMVLADVFGYDNTKSFKLMALIHSEGEAVVWTGSKEVAELKASREWCEQEGYDLDDFITGGFCC